ncbi:MAG: ribosome maturation factor RimP [Nostocoides sp.]
MVTASTIEPVVSPAVTAFGLIVEDVTVTPAGRRRVVRIVLDRHVADVGETTEATPPLTLDEIADASRAVGAAVDTSDVMGSAPYVLEVTSFGVGSPLTRPRHFRRNVTRRITVTTAEATITGRVEVVDDTGVTVRDDAGTEHTWPYADIRKAAVQVDFTRAEAVDPDGKGGAQPPTKERRN